jgi:UDP-N-acetylglucosamine 1-carboxyvinyltransferase
VQETIWENRFLHAQEFIKMGADLKVSENTVIINGVPKLHAASLKAHDLRGSAATILLALRAEGTSEIHQASQHYERGYSFFIEKLRLLGANISLNQRQSVEHYTELAKNDA